MPHTARVEEKATAEVSNLHLYVHPPYRFADTDKQQARFSGICRKIGTAESACATWRES